MRLMERLQTRLEETPSPGEAVNKVIHQSFFDAIFCKKKKKKIFFLQLVKKDNGTGTWTSSNNNNLPCSIRCRVFLAFIDIIVYGTGT